MKHVTDGRGTDFGTNLIYPFIKEKKAGIKKNLICYMMIYFTTDFFFFVGRGGGECSSSAVECLTQYRGAAGSSLTGVTALWSLSKTHLS